MKSLQFTGIVFLLAFVFSSCKSVPSPAIQREMSDRVAIVKHAQQFRGTPYRYGGATPKGFDCSGYVSYVYAHFGYKLPRSSDEMMKMGQKTDEKNALPGDLIFFTGSNKRSKKAGHVGIITDIRGDEIYFIHASSSSGIRIDSNEQEYYRSRFLQIRNVVR